MVRGHRRRVIRRFQGRPPDASRLPLHDGDRVAVIGGGPAGAFFAHFLLRLADAVGMHLDVDVYEPRSFGHSGPGGCNHCGGIVSESMVQILTAEGIVLPREVIQTGIDSYVVHMDIGTQRLEYLRDEERIAALYRGNGPRGGSPGSVRSFDGHLLGLAIRGGARHVQRLVTGIGSIDGLPALQQVGGRTSRGYHLVAVAAGVNSNLVPILRERPEPETTRTYISEFRVADPSVRRALGNSMHVFLLDLPRLKFAALIPKGDLVTMCMLGRRIDDDLVRDFLRSPEVQRCLPSHAVEALCRCSPLINVVGARPPFEDRVVYVGDAGVTRLYKDGIGAAFRTAKAAAQTAALVGVASEDFRKHYLPICKAIEGDNRIGKALFAGSLVFKKSRLARKAVLAMTAREQRRFSPHRPMSMVLWNLFTGSAPYRSILGQTVRPTFSLGLLAELLKPGTFRRSRAPFRGRPA